MEDYKRQLIKDEVYFNMAKEVAKLSKDKNTKVGALIVAQDGTPVSWGYNGAVAGFNDDVIPHSREPEPLTYSIRNHDTAITTDVEFQSNKYPFMSHAESNAIFFADKSKLVGSTIYVTGFPCENCAREIARAKISRVVIKTIKVDKGSTLNADNNNAMYEFASAGIELTIDGKNYTLRI